MSTFSSRLAAVRARIAAAAHSAGRSETEISLLAVSKTWPVAAILEAREAGLTAFGESYVQEAVAKIDALRASGIEWHHIGAVQRNKTRVIARDFAWVHGVERADIAERLAEARLETHATPLEVCLQINPGGEASKHGVAPDQALALASTVAGLRGIRLRGLMAIPRASDDFAEQRAQFHVVRVLFDELNAQGFSLDTLSMGMSGDLEAAIAEGATMVRIGTALFGPRPRND